MAGPSLPVNVDTTYADDAGDASVKAHQQHHDTIHGIINALDAGIGTAAPGQVLTYNGSVYVPASGGGAADGLRPPVGGAFSPGYPAANVIAPAVGTLTLGLMLVPTGTWDAVIGRVSTPQSGATVKFVGYAVNASTGGPIGAPVIESAAVAATSGGYISATLSTPLVVAAPGRLIWIGLVNQGSAAAEFWYCNTAYGLPRMVGTASNLDLGGVSAPSAVTVTGVTGSAPSSPTFAWETYGSVYKLGLRRSA